MNAMMDVLRRAGLDETTARSAYGALHTYTIGFAALEEAPVGASEVVSPGYCHVALAADFGHPEQIAVRGAETRGRADEPGGPGGRYSFFCSELYE
jgi:hypothetical protein